MLDSIGKKILMTFFKGVIHFEKDDEIEFNKLRGEILKKNA